MIKTKHGNSMILIAYEDFKDLAKKNTFRQGFKR